MVDHIPNANNYVYLFILKLCYEPNNDLMS